jgi:CIC family chloride channel protein
MKLIQTTHKFHYRLKNVFQMAKQGKTAQVTLLAIFTGVFGGIGAVIFRLMIQMNNTLFFGTFSRFTSSSIGLFIIPILGGLLVGQITSRVAWETKGHGVPEIMEAVELEHGVIRPRVPFAKVIASSICIGSGGSCGREGPIAQIGAGFGSIMGVKLHLRESDMRTLVVAGVSAGIAATFNAPLGGILFGIEIILLGRLSPRSFIPICLAVITGMSVSTYFLGTTPAFVVPAYRHEHPLEILFYLLLGLMCGLVSVGWVRGFYLIEDLFEKLPLRNDLKPALGGAIVGLISIIGYEEVQGVGYETIEAVIKNNLLVESLLLLCLFKIVATACSIGSGGSGGVFAPSLFVGAMLGGAYGYFVVRVIPEASAGAYAVVAMAAVFAGAARAPLTMIFMTMELTRDYQMVLPIIAAVAVSYLVSEALMEENIYTLKLLHRGVNLRAAQYKDSLDVVTVGEAMRKREEILHFHPEDTQEYILQCHTSGDYVYKRYPVLALDNHHLLGVVTLGQIVDMIETDSFPGTIGDIMIKGDQMAVVYAKETLHHALNQLVRYGVNSLPVLSSKREPNPEFVGLISRTDILVALEAYISSQEAADAG